MKKIMTVTGEQSPEHLGFCQCHEHLMISRGVSHRTNPALLIDDVEKSMQEVQRFRQMGGNTIVDAQPGGCNRMESALFKISTTTGVNIIAATGFHKLIFYPEHHWIYTKSLNELQNIFLHELQKGMYCNIDHEFHEEFVPCLAGIVKAALDLEGLSPVYQKLFRAAAFAAVTCDVPLMVHIEQGADPLSLLSFLFEQQVTPQRIIFCHMDRTIEPLSYYTACLSHGITLEFDTIGRYHYHDDEAEISLIKNLLDRGYEKQLLCSLDTTRTRLKSYTPDAIGLDFLLTTYLPLMKKYGITEEQLQNVFLHNPVNIFTSQSAAV